MDANDDITDCIQSVGGNLVASQRIRFDHLAKAPKKLGTVFFESIKHMNVGVGFSHVEFGHAIFGAIGVEPFHEGCVVGFPAEELSEFAMDDVSGGLEKLNVFVKRFHRDFFFGVLLEVLDGAIVKGFHSNCQKDFGARAMHCLKELVVGCHC